MRAAGAGARRGVYRRGGAIGEGRGGERGRTPRSPICVSHQRGAVRGGGAIIPQFRFCRVQCRPSFGSSTIVARRRGVAAREWAPARPIRSPSPSSTFCSRHSKRDQGIRDSDSNIQSNQYPMHIGLRFDPDEATSTYYFTVCPLYYCFI